jgi:hypothetical protein
MCVVKTDFRSSFKNLAKLQTDTMICRQKNVSRMTIFLLATKTLLFSLETKQTWWEPWPLPSVVFVVSICWGNRTKTSEDKCRRSVMFVSYLLKQQCFLLWAKKVVIVETFLALSHFVDLLFWQPLKRRPGACTIKLYTAIFVYTFCKLECLPLPFTSTLV